MEGGARAWACEPARAFVSRKAKSNQATRSATRSTCIAAICGTSTGAPVCSVLQTGAPLDVPQIATIDVERVAEQVAWFDFAFRLTNARAGSHAQARAPPATVSYTHLTLPTKRIV